MNGAKYTRNCSSICSTKPRPSGGKFSATASRGVCAASSETLPMSTDEHSGGTEDSGGKKTITLMMAPRALPDFGLSLCSSVGIAIPNRKYQLAALTLWANGRHKPAVRPVVFALHQPAYAGRCPVVRAVFFPFVTWQAFGVD